MKIIYAANILIVGWVSISSLLFPEYAKNQLFDNAFQYSESIRLVGALLFSIVVLSILGLFYPEEMSLIFLFQLIYKTAWLLVSGLPSIIKGKPYPRVMTIVFVVYLIVLPFAIPWGYFFG